MTIQTGLKFLYKEDNIEPDTTLNLIIQSAKEFCRDGIKDIKVRDLEDSILGLSKMILSLDKHIVERKELPKRWKK